MVKLQNFWMNTMELKHYVSYICYYIWCTVWTKSDKIMKIEILKFEISDFWNFIFRNFLLCEIPLNGMIFITLFSKIRNLCHRISCFGCMCNVDRYHKRKFIKGNFENQNFNFQKFKIWFSQFQFFWNLKFPKKEISSKIIKFMI